MFKLIMLIKAFSFIFQSEQITMYLIYCEEI